VSDFNDARDRAYNVRRAIPEHPQIFQAWRQSSDDYLASRDDALIDVAYGDDERQRLDLFPAISVDGPHDAPLVIVIHGGYWQALDKADNRHVCRSLCEAGWAVALLNYRLCPLVEIRDIVDDVEMATCWLVENQQRLCLDCDQIAVIGHSAGAHLAAMLACRSAQDANLMGGRIQHVSLVSGIFELESLIGTRMNEQLGLTPQKSLALSPSHFNPPVGLSVDSTAGALETIGFFDQQAYLAHAWADTTHWLQASIVDADHFTVWSQIGDPSSIMAKRIVTSLQRLGSG
jgi:arylformamidase